MVAQLEHGGRICRDYNVMFEIRVSFIQHRSMRRAEATASERKFGNIMQCERNTCRSAKLFTSFSRSLCHRFRLANQCDPINEKLQPKKWTRIRKTVESVCSMLYADHRHNRWPLSLKPFDCFVSQFIAHATCNMQHNMRVARREHRWKHRTCIASVSCTVHPTRSQLIPYDIVSVRLLIFHPKFITLSVFGGHRAQHIPNYFIIKIENKWFSDCLCDLCLKSTWFQSFPCDRRYTFTDYTWSQFSCSSTYTSSSSSFPNYILLPSIFIPSNEFFNLQNCDRNRNNVRKNLIVVSESITYWLRIAVFRGILQVIPTSMHLQVI